MKVFSILFGLLLVAGAGMIFALSQRSASEEQAGYAYADPSSEVDSDRSLESFDGTGGPEGAVRNSSRHRTKDPASPAGEEWLTGFELIERSGGSVSSQDLSGQPYVVSFFFTLCPSICVNQNAKMEELQTRYLGKPVRFLSISCDPEIDRPEVLSAYAKRFNADPQQWLFLTGDMGYITRVAGELYSLAAERRFHAEKFVLVDAAGKNVGFYTWSDPLQYAALEREIDKLLAE